MTTTQNALQGNNIHFSHNLSGDVEALAAHYDAWASKYDKEVFDEGYQAPMYIVDLMESLIDKAQLPPDTCEIMDAGCGTGLVGKILFSRGYTQVDGFDLSEEMVKVALKTKAYRRLLGQCDLTKRILAFGDDRYDVTLAAGVFTLGHVFPSSLIELLHLTKPGGLVIVSTRLRYADQTDFEQMCHSLEREGRLEMVQVHKKAPYIAEEPAHYWAMRVK